MPEVKVPQKDGQIIITRSGESKTRNVSDHIVEVADEDLRLFLTVVDDSGVVDKKKKDK